MYFADKINTCDLLFDAMCITWSHWNCSRRANERKKKEEEKKHVHALLLVCVRNVYLVENVWIGKLKWNIRSSRSHRSKFQYFLCNWIQCTVDSNLLNEIDAKLSNFWEMIFVQKPNRKKKRNRKFDGKSNRIDMHIFCKRFQRQCFRLLFCPALLVTPASHFLSPLFVACALESCYEIDNASNYNGFRWEEEREKHEMKVLIVFYEMRTQTLCFQFMFGQQSAIIAMRKVKKKWTNGIDWINFLVFTIKIADANLFKQYWLQLTKRAKCVSLHTRISQKLSHSESFFSDSVVVN